MDGRMLRPLDSEQYRQRFEHIACRESMNLEDELRERVCAARIAHQKARHEHERLLALVTDLGPNHVDGGIALKRAVQNGRETLENLKEALMVFDDLLSRNLLPPKK